MCNVKYVRNPNKGSIYYWDWWLITLINPSLRFLTEWTGILLLTVLAIIALLLALGIFHVSWLCCSGEDSKVLIATVGSIMGYFGIIRHKIKYAEIRMELSKQIYHDYVKPA
jgi:hypothetical protein